EGSFTTEVFLAFLRRLVRSVPRKVFLVVDLHPVHRAHQVQQWVSQHSDQLELFYLPPYSPERNPDEYLNQEIKAHVTRQRRPHHVAGLKRMVRAYLHQLQQWPEKLSHFFWLPQVQDAGL
ncbi:MAG: IS630 family transposase, partial [Cyanobacteria bacterium QH_3_48_40]